MSLGIPYDASTAVLLGALFLLGIFPGPELFRYDPDIAGGIFLAYLVDNVALLVLGLTLAPVFGAVLKLRETWLLRGVLLLSVKGTYSLQHSVFDMWVILVFRLIGYLMRRGGFSLAPVIIGLILGPVLENNLRRSLLISRDGLAIFVERSFSVTIPAIAGLLLACIIWTANSTGRK
ncbi:Tripartite tricarboxylate transporter TctA family protein [Flavimaricola marinus]|uniref:Tripartite tricarboxylate transporter TctA family protein n=1 Tax=Flavimaricola marinus TaxID=1819565 RepID=A0A238LLX3_9RHOB|nr:Tripartite tricarboxylate transporter TctA family protein [Flavimaricola marinus]